MSNIWGAAHIPVGAGLPANTGEARAIHHGVGFATQGRTWSEVTSSDLFIAPLQ
ncbi:hypothetical protein YSA_09620 [Pseudomonas putida ND6]|uniref:Uncharacterized protein n=1 Tax=Pseudomonas putida ND6 TaxID=231023 RepID=I3V2L4_PSEPU|nr:hypothetical protein YSA_09620 [Pseudomonas putida ND6]